MVQHISWEALKELLMEDCWRSAEENSSTGGGVDLWRCSWLCVKVIWKYICISSLYFVYIWFYLGSIFRHVSLALGRLQFILIYVWYGCSTIVSINSMVGYNNLSWYYRRYTPERHRHGYYWYQHLCSTTPRLKSAIINRDEQYILGVCNLHITTMANRYCR